MSGRLLYYTNIVKADNKSSDLLEDFVRAHLLYKDRKQICILVSLASIFWSI